MATVVDQARESFERGRAAREHTPRSSHAEWAPSASREDPIVVLERQAATRVPELVPIRYGRMLASPFAFYRGAAALMSMDLADSPRSGIETQICGDAHLANFGLFAAPDRRLVFDLNDFDETLFGPWEWDVKRLATSFEIAGRHLGFASACTEQVVAGMVLAYREAIARFADLGHLDVWYARMDIDDVIAENAATAARDSVRAAERVKAKALRKTSLRAVKRLTTVVDGRVRFRSEPPVLVPISELHPELDADDVAERFTQLFAAYQESLEPRRRQLLATYRFADMARKVVGVGSVGTRAWIVLLEGRDAQDPLVLQAKEAQASVLEQHLQPSPYATHGQRVVEGQRYMQAASDIFLGWERINGLDGQERDFYVRQLWDGKGSADVDRMNPDKLTVYGRICGMALARAHARAGDRGAIAAYLGRRPSFDRAVVRFARRYAEQNARDYQALHDAVREGRIVAADPVSG